MLRYASAVSYRPRPALGTLTLNPSLRLNLPSGPLRTPQLPQAAFTPTLPTESSPQVVEETNVGTSLAERYAQYARTYMIVASVSLLTVVGAGVYITTRRKAPTANRRRRSA